RGNSTADARNAARTTLSKLAASAKPAGASDYQALTAGTMSWWRSFWEKTAAVHTPDEDLQLLYYLGIYKLGCVSVPGRPAATLQGPWIEDHRLPPYSNDYHFNVNVQEMHWPAFASNHLETLEPLWALLKSWRPRMKQMARRFAGVEDGLQLPHAADDRCVAMGGIWSIDHASTAWTAQLAWLYWKYSGDTSFLCETAYPLMKGAMRVYEAMLEDDGERLCLPLNFSSEFGYSFVEATGKNPSYQLAMINFLCRALLEVSGQRGLTATAKETARWKEIIARLPVVTASARRESKNPWALLGPYGFTAQLDKDEKTRLSPAELRELNPPPCWMGKEIDPAAINGAGEILLWEGQPLRESHRHHSHLAGIYPLDVLDFYPDGKHYALVYNAIRNHALQGMGTWSGWCISWASIIHARLRNGGMAALLLNILRRGFMRTGYATTHDPVFPGFTDDNQRNFMQLDAALGAAAAVLEMLAHTAQGAIRIFPAVPAGWQSASFAGIRCEGGLLVSGKMENGRVLRVELSAESDGRHRLENPFKGRGAIACYARGKVVKCGGDLEFIDLAVAAGDKIEIK
ncbi:MAG: hypothetical protein Q8O57_01490, partial [Kiritimatiellota bacterium]|nr:hypothetical protein [Kiritimatiellota bacterium]